MELQSHPIQVSTRGHTDVVDITPKIQQVVQKSRLQEGSASIFVIGSTAGLTTVEYEPGLVKDLQEAFERVAPRGKAYAHHERWGDDNGHSHVRASLLGPSLAIPFMAGKLVLGTWQQVVLIDFDTRARERDLIVQLAGK